ncbi:MAG: Benzylsuccinate synthase alpha subunit [Firmicutes bacterium ADurb.Bin182]|nr:MAG: Benzylsuccinate synthase alpha subunit [Firmicutes bacterium ADurb.Bin182]
MTERIEKLKSQSMSAVPHIDISRAKLFTEAYKLFEGAVSVPVLRAKAFYHYMENKPLYIGDGELIIGEKGSSPQAAPTFPELCCHTVEDLNIMDSREKISFKVSGETKRMQAEEIIPFWEKRSMRTRIFQNLDDEWKACYGAGLFTEFMEQRGPGHTVGGGVFYKKGFLQLKDEIQSEIAALDFLSDRDALTKREQLKAMAIACDAIMLYAKRNHDFALDKAREEPDPARKAELLKIAENCAVVPANAPKNFWQALQMYWFVHIGVTTELNPWDAFSPGRLDQHIYPFYKADVQSGELDEEKALELLECLWVKFNNQPAPPKVGITLKESSTYTDFANINTGGISPDGSDGVNDVSYLILRCMDEMKLLQPSSNVQISRKNPQKFLLEACKIARKGWGQPAFYNTEAIVSELLNAGKTIEDARKGGSSGCVETGCFGNEAYILTGYFNIPKVLEITLNNGFDPISSQQLGPKTGRAEDFKSYGELMEAFKTQMNHFLDIKIRGNHIIEKLYAENMPVPFLSCVVNDCIKKGKDYNAGGARYNTNYIQGVGIGTVTDSLSAIKFNVFDNKNFSMNELTDALKRDFEGCERIYRLVTDRTPKYGNDDDYADEIMKSVFRIFRDSVTGRPNIKGGSYRIDMLPTTCHVYFGEVLGASANGRKKGKPVSEGISPDKGADRKGPTAVLKSCSKMDHLSTGGTLLNQKFTPSVVEGETGLLQLANLIRAYFNMDGHHIQFNVVDRQTLIDAQNDPEGTKDLIVRVAGYSDYFHNLSRTLQDEIIERTEQSFC